MYMDDIKIFAQNEKEFEILIQTIRIYCQCVPTMLIMKRGKRETTEGRELPNQESIRTIERRKITSTWETRIYPRKWDVKNYLGYWNTNGLPIPDKKARFSVKESRLSTLQHCQDWLEYSQEFRKLDFNQNTLKDLQLTLVWKTHKEWNNDI